MENTIEDLKKVLMKRFGDPVIGTFIIAWIATNWQLILILIFSNSSIEYRTNLIKECYLDWTCGLLIPLGISLLHNIVTPWINALVEYLTTEVWKWRNKIQSERKIALIETDKNEANRQIELAEKKRDLTKYEEETKSYEDAIARLQKDYNILLNDSNKKQVSMDIRDQKLKEGEMKLSHDRKRFEQTKKMR